MRQTDAADNEVVPTTPTHYNGGKELAPWSVPGVILRYYAIMRQVNLDDLKTQPTKHDDMPTTPACTSDCAIETTPVVHHDESITDESGSTAVPGRHSQQTVSSGGNQLSCTWQQNPIELKATNTYELAKNQGPFLIVNCFYYDKKPFSDS